MPKIVSILKDQKTRLEKSYCGSHAAEHLFSVITLKLIICFGEAEAMQIMRFYSFGVYRGFNVSGLTEPLTFDVCLPAIFLR